MASLLRLSDLKGMNVLPDFVLFAVEDSAGIAAGAENLLGSAMESSLPLLKALAVLIIVWGVVCAALRLVGMEIKVLRGQPYKRDAEVIREHLGYYLLLALEFLIAVDVIETLMHPDWKEFAILAGLVVLRTVMSFSLHWELKEIKKEAPSDEVSAASGGS